MAAHVVSIARQFSKTPGARYKSDGPYSGELFRDEFLQPIFRGLQPGDLVEVDLDGVQGYATSFLEEAFGGLARIYGADRCLKALRFVSRDDPSLIDEILGYIHRAK